VGEPLSRPRIPGEDLPSGSTAVVDDQRAASAGAAQSPAPPRRAHRHLDVLLRSPRGTHGPRAAWRMRPDAVSLGPDPELAKIENAGPGIDRVVVVTVAEGQWQAPGERPGIRRGRVVHVVRRVVVVIGADEVEYPSDGIPGGRVRIRELV